MYRHPEKMDYNGGDVNMEKAMVYVLSEDGTYLEKEFIELLLKPVRKKFEVVNDPAMNHILMEAGHENGKSIRNALNDPLYLLGEIESSDVADIVIAYDEDPEGVPRPKYLVGDDEIRMLMTELEKNPDTDAWKTAVKVNKAIRR